MNNRANFPIGMANKVQIKDSPKENKQSKINISIQIQLIKTFLKTINHQKELKILIPYPISFFLLFLYYY